MPSKKKEAISTRIRRMAKQNEYHACKSKGLWYIENMAYPPRPTSQEGLTDEKAIRWLKANGYINLPV